VDPDEAVAASDPGEEGDDPSPPPAALPAPPHTLADEAARELAAMRSSEYVHRTSVDEAVGRFDYDCSGFVTYALARAFPEAHAAVRASVFRRPLAKDYVAFVQALGRPLHGWSRVPDVAHLAAGDLVAWLTPADLVSRNTGHIMIVAGPARPRSPGGSAGTREWAIPIYDSSASFHGADDTRKATRSSGLGHGAIVLVTSGDGVPLGYRWSERSRSKRYDTAIVLARVEGAAR
jgi:hypothetical protein